MSEKVKKAVALLLALVLGFSLAACSGNTETASADENDPENTETSESGQQSESPEEEPDDVPVESGTIRTDINLINEEELAGLDIMQTNKTFTRSVLVQVYEGLTFDNEDGTWDYLLAEDIQVSDDALTYDVKVKEGVLFHNGEEMKASDVAFSINRAVTMPYLAAYTGSIENAEATGDYTLVIHMKQPYAPMMTDLSYIPVQNETLVTEAGDDKMMTEPIPCATGPYMVTEFDETHVKLEAHEGYHRGAPQIKTVNYKIVTDASTRLIAFEAGEVDALNVPTSNWASIVASGKYGTEIVPTNHYSMIELNLYGTYTSDPLIRQAIAHAVDPEGVNAMAYDGLAVVTDRLADPLYVFGAPEEGFTWNYDPELSKELLAEAGYPDGLDIGEITVAGGGYYEKMAVAIAGYLDAVGIHGQVVTYDSATVGNKSRGNDYEIAVSGWPLTSDYNFFREKWHSESNAATHNDVNDNYIDDMFDKGAAELDPEKRKEIYAELDTYLAEYCLYIPIFHKTSCWAFDPDLNFSSGLNNYYIYNWSWKK